MGRRRILLKLVLAIFAGLTVTIVQIVTSVFVRSQWLNWALPGFLIMRGVYYRLQGLPLIAVAIVVNVIAWSLPVFLLLRIIGRRAGSHL